MNFSNVVRKSLTWRTRVRSAILQMGLVFVFVFLSSAICPAEHLASEPGWYFTNYEFKEPKVKTNTSQSGTGKGLYTLREFQGKKNNGIIQLGRYDSKTGKKFAEVRFSVQWSDPPAVLKPGSYCSFDLERKTLSSEVWSASKLAARLGSSVVFLNHLGKELVKTDMKTTMTSKSKIPKGKEGQETFVRITMGQGFSATYHYEWRD